MSSRRSCRRRPTSPTGGCLHCVCDEVQSVAVPATCLQMRTGSRHPTCIEHLSMQLAFLHAFQRPLTHIAQQHHAEHPAGPWEAMPAAVTWHCTGCFEQVAHRLEPMSLHGNGPCHEAQILHNTLQELQADDAAARLAGRRRQGAHVLQRRARRAARRRHLLQPQLRVQGAERFQRAETPHRLPPATCCLWMRPLCSWTSTQAACGAMSQAEVVSQIV